jgi:cardiolipin synthase
MVTSARTYPPATLLAALVILTGQSPVAQAATVAPAQTRPAAEPPMIALDGYRNDDLFFVRYRAGDEIRYSGGNWRDRVRLVDDPDAEEREYAIPSLVPLQYHRETHWDELPADVHPVRILDVEVWQTLRDRLMESIVPRDRSAGTVVGFENADYFLFYGPDGQFEATRLQDKPADYSIEEHLRFDEYIRRGRPILDQYLAERGITEQEFVFNTGDAGLYSMPFLYVNTERRVLVFVRYVPLSPVATPPPAGTAVTQAFGHVLGSHLTALALRPVTSLHRLLFVVTDTAAETLRPDWLTMAAVDQPAKPLAPAEPMDLAAWDRQLDRIASEPASQGTIEFLVDGEAFFTRFIDSVASAEDSVHIRAYIFDNDDYAVRIGELLKRRSNEGVDVKILLDGIGTITSTLEDPDTLPEYHIPPPSVRRYLQSDSRISVRQVTNPWLTGDHVKTMVIDHELAFAGGMNIGREYRYDWHDLMMEIRGPVVSVIDNEFEAAWAHAGVLGDFGYFFSRLGQTRAAITPSGYPIRVLYTKAGASEIFVAQREAIRRARSYVFIENAYFTDDALLQELVLARHRGVDVRVIIPMETDRGPITRDNALAANVMLANGIRVFIYPGFSHVKAAIFDGWACVGSANLDRLSLHINLELNLATAEPSAVNQLMERLFEPDFRISPELKEPFPERWVDHLVEIIGDYIF